MLKTIDVLIGLIVILLALSMAVTVITQALTTIVNSRGRHLRRGLADLLSLLDPDLTETIGRHVATRILTHPLVSGSSVPFVGTARLGNVIHREEFTKLLIGLATDDALLRADARAGLTTDAREVLKAVLKKQGVDNPQATLQNIRTLSLELERSTPQLSNMARQNAAILRAAPSDLVSKINSWFDQTMDRTSQRFTASTRAITFAGAFIVSFGLQVDTPLVVNRLAADDKLREAFVQEAMSMSKTPPSNAVTSPTPGSLPSSGRPLTSDADAAKADETEQPAGTSTPQSSTDTQPAQQKTDGQLTGAQKTEQQIAEEQAREARRYREFLANYGIIKLPSAADWKDGYSSAAGLLGMLLTALLLSLGAPFWYNALGQLLQLRSALAVKEDVQRASRQTNGPADAAGVPDARRAMAPAPGGERGDVAAL